MEARNIVGNEADQARNIKLNTVREFVRSGRLTKGVDGSVLELVSKEDFKKILKGDNKLLEEKTANIIQNETHFNKIIESMENKPFMINDGVKKLREPKITKRFGKERYEVGDISLDRIGLQTSFGGVQTTQKTTLIDSLASYILRRTEGAYPLEQVQQVTSDRIRSQLLKDFIAINPSKKSSLSKTDIELLERGTFLEPAYESKLTQLAQKEFVGKDGKPKNLEMIPSKSGRDAIRKTGESSDEDFLKQFTDDPSAYAGPIMSEEYLMYGGRKPGKGVKQVMSREDAQKIMKAQSDRLDEARGIRKSEYDTEVQIEEIMQKDILAKYGGTFTPPKSLAEILSIRNKIAINKSEIAENNRRIENLKQSQKGDPDKLNKLENETENLIQETKNLEKADRAHTTNITKMNPTDFVNQALFKSPSQLGEGFLPSSVMAYGATAVFLGDTLPEAAAQIQPKTEEFTILPKPEPPTLKTTTMTSTATQQGQGQSGKVVPLEIQVPKLQDELKTGNVMDVVQKQFTPQMIRERVIQAPGLRTGLRAGAALTTPLTYQQAFATALDPPDTTQRLYIPKEAPRLTPPPKRPGPVAPFMLPPFIAATWDETEAQRQKKRKKRKAFWDVPDQWWKPGYWSMKPSSLTGKMDRLGAGYTTFKSTEPRRARKKKNQWDLY